MRPGRLAALCGGLLFLLCAGGCPYGFSSSLLPAHIKTVAVPLPENRTDRGDLGPALADSLVEAFLDRNVLKIADEQNADSRVECVILEYIRRPYTVDENENVQEYRLEIIAEVRFVDIRKNKTLWEEARLSQWDTYNFTQVGGQPAETEEQGIGKVLSKLTDDIVNRTVEGW
ncbi:MAG TPA: LptE family protein [bacterium]|nr:LptE family protein [bacterium]